MRIRLSTSQPYQLDLVISTFLRDHSIADFRTMENGTQSFDTDDDNLIVIPRSKEATGSSKHEKRAFQKRRRSRACLACRTRKTKCDTPTSGPCSSCTSASLVCKFSDESEDKRKVGPARQVRHLQAAVQELTQKLEIAEGKLREREEAARSSKATTSSASSLTPNPQSPPTKVTPEADNQRRMSYNNKSDVDAAVRRGSTNRLVGDKGSNVLYFGPTSGLGFVSSVQEFVEGLGYQTSANWTQAALDNHSHSGLVDSRDASSIDLRVLLPPRETAEKLISVYKETVQKYMPCLYWPSARRKLNRAYDAPITLSDEQTLTGSFCFAMMVMAYGCLSLDPSDIPLVGSQDPLRRGWEYYECARKYHDLNKARFHIDDAIVLTIMAIYLDGLALPSPSWMAVGSLARVCLDIGLHLPPTPEMFTGTELEIRNRVFWGAYNLDRKLSIQFGRPPVFQEYEIEAELPGYYDAGGVTNDSDQDEPKSIDVGIQMFRVVIQNSIASHPILKLDPATQTEDELEESIREIDDKIISYQGNASSMYDIRNNDPLDPMIIKFLFHLLSARISIHRFFTDTTISPRFRTQCLIRSLDVGKCVVHILRRTIRWPNWQTAFRNQQSELVYQVTTKTAIVFLLGYHMLEGQPELQFDAPGHIRVCVEVLKEASPVRPTAAKGLEVIDNLANTLGFEIEQTRSSRGEVNGTMSISTSTQQAYPPVTTTTAPAITFHSEQNSATRQFNGNGAGTYGSGMLPPPHPTSHVDPSLPGSLAPTHIRAPPPGDIHWDNPKPWLNVNSMGSEAGTAAHYNGHVPSVQPVQWPENVDGLDWDVFQKVLGSTMGPSVDPSLMSIPPDQE